MKNSLIVFLVLVGLTACAQPKQQQGVEHFSNDFATGVKVLIGFWEPNLLALDVNNPYREFINIWLKQEYNTPTERTTKETLLYAGMDGTMHKTFKLSYFAKGEEKVTVKTLDNQGKIILQEEIK